MSTARKRPNAVDVDKTREKICKMMQRHMMTARWEVAPGPRDATMEAMMPTAAEAVGADNSEEMNRVVEETRGVWSLVLTR